jgi:hypothetical protein
VRQVSIWGYVDEKQFRAVVELAVTYHDEAVRCAGAGAHYAACIMVGAAVEAALLATAAIYRDDLSDSPIWPKRKDGKAALEDLTLAELTCLARDAGWLPALGRGEQRHLSDSEVGDAVDFLRGLRNLAVHPGRHVRNDAEVQLGEVAYRNAYGVLQAVFDETYKVIQALE